MKRGLATFLGVWATVAVLSGCAPAAEPKAPTDAPTFVSLNPCLDAILVEASKPEQILSISHYSHQPGGSRMDPAIARRFASNSGTAEEIIALDPDIVLASAFLPPATRAALERAGLHIETFDSPKTIEQSAAQIERIATLAGHSDHAEYIAGMMHSPAVFTLNPSTLGKVPGPDPSVLLWQAGQIVAGQETLIAQILKEEGFTSHSEALGLGQADYVRLEQVLVDPPDLLLVAGDSAGQKHPALDQLTDTRVGYFDPSLFYCGGPSVGEARGELFMWRLEFYQDAP